jgi:hypothetical protein
MIVGSLLAISLVLFPLSIGTWIAGRYVDFGIKHVGTAHGFDLTFGHGLVQVQTWRILVVKEPPHWTFGQMNRPNLFSDFFATDSEGKTPSIWNRIGFESSTFDVTVGGMSMPNQRIVEGSALIVPEWLVLGLSSILPLLLVRRKLLARRRRKRLSKGCCARCGYDLRATPQRCPECGWIVTGRDLPSQA